MDGGPPAQAAPDREPAVQPYAGKEVVFGTRPEDIHDRAFVPPGIRAEPMTCQVDVTELMGNEIFVYLLTGRAIHRSGYPRTQARVGNEMDVVINMDNTHLFDRDTEQAIR